jgi:hypothetical protein
MKVGWIERSEEVGVFGAVDPRLGVLPPEPLRCASAGLQRSTSPKSVKAKQAKEWATNRGDRNAGKEPLPVFIISSNRPRNVSCITSHLADPILGTIIKS